MVERVGWLSFNSSLLRERLVSYPYPYPGPPGQAGWLSDTYPYLLHIMHPTGGRMTPVGREPSRGPTSPTHAASTSARDAPSTT